MLEVVGQLSDWPPALVLLLVVAGLISVVIGLMVIVRASRTAAGR